MMAEDTLIEGLKALAHPLRWRILTTLSNGERNVGELEQATGITQPALSQQLGVLRKAGLVDTRKEAKLVFYSLAQDELAGIATAFAHLAPTKFSMAASTTPSQRTPAPGVANFARLT
jgi:DNA-binding transcriptional ArsR family regulator